MGIFTIYLQVGASRPRVKVHDKNPHTAGNQKNCIAIRLKECLHGHQIKRPFSEKSFDTDVERSFNQMMALIHVFVRINMHLESKPTFVQANIRLDEYLRR